MLANKPAACSTQEVLPVSEKLVSLFDLLRTKFLNSIMLMVSPVTSPFIILALY